MASHNIAIIIPTYNEAENIARLIDLIFAEELGADVVVVDDNSPDNTAGIVKILQKKYAGVYLKQRDAKLGLASAYLETLHDLIRSDKYTAFVTMDGDLSHNPKFLKHMLNVLDSNDIVVGSRYIQGGGVINWPPHRKILSLFGNLYARTILNVGVCDLTSGFMVIKADFLRNIKLNSISSTGYAFLMELKFAMIISGARAVEVPITFVNRTDGASKISSHIIKEGLIMPFILRRRKKARYSKL